MIFLVSDRTFPDDRIFISIPIIEEEEEERKEEEMEKIYIEFNLDPERIKYLQNLEDKAKYYLIIKTLIKLLSIIISMIYAILTIKEKYYESHLRIMLMFKLPEIHSQILDLIKRNIIKVDEKFEIEFNGEISKEISLQDVLINIEKIILWYKISPLFYSFLYGYQIFVMDKDPKEFPGADIINVVMDVYNNLPDHLKEPFLSVMEFLKIGDFYLIISKGVVYKIEKNNLKISESEKKVPTKFEEIKTHLVNLTLFLVFRILMSIIIEKPKNIDDEKIFMLEILNKLDDILGEDFKSTIFMRGKTRYLLPGFSEDLIHELTRRLFGQSGRLSLNQIRERIWDLE